MKSLHRMAVGVFFALLPALIVGLSILPADSASAGVLNFKMTAPKTTLTIGETVTVTVSAWVDDAVSGNGLDTWQLDLGVDHTGVIAITKTGSVADITLLAPNPHPMFSGWSATSVNSPVSGEVRNVAVMQQTYGAPSSVGVGGYTNILSFNIQAMSTGTATYTVCDNGGGLFGILVDAAEYDNSVIPGSVVFDSGSSNRTFTVVPVPEPMSLAIFALAGSLAAIRRRK